MFILICLLRNHSIFPVFVVEEGPTKCKEEQPAPEKEPNISKLRGTTLELFVSGSGKN